MYRTSACSLWGFPDDGEDGYGEEEEDRVQLHLDEQCRV